MRQSIVWCRVTVQWFLQWQWHTADGMLLHYNNHCSWHAGMLQQTPTSAAISNVLARHTVPQKNDTDVACYSFNICRAILTTFGRNVVERVRYQKVVYLPTSANYWLYTTRGKHKPRKLRSSTHAVSTACQSLTSLHVIFFWLVVNVHTAAWLHKSCNLIL